MSGVNKVILLGRLGSAPDLKYTAGGIPVAKFSLATSEVWIGKDGNKQEETTWHKIVVWNKMAENCAKYLDKGRQVYVEGKISVVSWDDKQTGKKAYATEIVANNVQFIGEGNQNQRPPQQPQQQQAYAQDPSASYGLPAPGLDDIPF
jgi:single-strand DNA-binding protein